MATLRTLRYMHEDLPVHLAAAGFTDAGDDRHMIFTSDTGRVVVDFNPPGLHHRAVKVDVYDPQTGLIVWSQYFADDTPYDAVKAFILAALPLSSRAVEARRILRGAGIDPKTRKIAAVRELRQAWGPVLSLREFRELVESL